MTVQSVSGGGSTNSHSYCEVDSARGSFRSRSVVVGEGTTGEPCNKDVHIHVLVQTRAMYVMKITKTCYLKQSAVVILNVFVC